MGAILEINKLVLPVTIGVELLERNKPQDIEFNLVIDFISMPTACHSDNIMDAICYAKIVEEIKAFCLVREFHLIEYLGHELHQYLQALFPRMKLKLQVCKVPPIDEIKGNCCFTVY